MDDDIIARMRGEEADLSRKLKAVRDLLVAYGQDVGTPHVSLPATAIKVGPPRAAAAASSRDKVGIDGFGPYGKGIVATAMAAMLDSPDNLKTRAIVEFLEARNVAITGENKVNAVGALLSRSSDIASHGKAGWSLVSDDRAKEIVSQYAHKENEPSEELSMEDLLDGSETAQPAQDGGPQEW